ncbi:MAG: LysR substrate-binding domain-containing protein [Bacteroidales bacterium]|jgi:LysR family transcriptional regulator, transcriptional activator of the cysJI operon|nr:LysR substrate-binding domain-containing protein [Bacteroidales bacterium]MDD2204092.1 LysR substrate-binding domain-containing protein [Bacteroidales bacterium]MDD3151788.1 LysR substrate-binding domain-containing protein [Bacteroidales bacterium]MDD3913756.1 LysR substrate-binding domain-containing protein [Bacteroidales bacterium]MDD4633521.1 LysR substrate-binding domain-containing protein [Bacteroidales bacterium]
MEDFRLKVFVSAAHNLNFTKTSQELFISQPAVSKNIVELENSFGLPLFNRSGSHLSLTAAGERLLQYAEKILDEYNTMNYEMSLLTDNLRGTLSIGASSTIAQYFIPPVLAKFIQYFPEVKISLLSGNSTQVEEAMFQHKIDLGIVENAGRCKGLHYEDVVNDELVLVANSRGKYADVDEVTMDELCKTPIVLREHGSGTLEVIEAAFAAVNYKLNMFNVIMQLGSTEAIKSFIQNVDALAIISIIAANKELKDGTLKIIDIKDVEMKRWFAFVTRYGEQSKLNKRFCEFIERLCNNF